MLKGRRADLHARYADWVEREAGERAGEYDEILGYHLERAYRYLSELGPVDERGRELARPRRRPARLVRAAARSRAATSGPPSACSSVPSLLLDDDDPARRDLTIKLGIALAETGQLTRVDALLRSASRPSAGSVRRLPRSGGRQHVVSLDAERSRIGRRAGQRRRAAPGTTRSRAATPASRAGRRAGSWSTTARATAPT